MDMSPIHQVCPKPFCKAQWKGEEDTADRKRGGKTTTGNGWAWSLSSPRGQLRTEKNGGNWLWSHLWCPSELCSKGIGEGRIVLITESWLGHVSVAQVQMKACFVVCSRVSFYSTDYMKNVHKPQDHVVLLHVPEYHTVIQSRELTVTTPSFSHVS